MFELFVRVGDKINELKRFTNFNSLILLVNANK
jgi:hypothetical protein